MERNTRELHERVMGIRMLPVGTLFQRYTRTVYDIAQATGKQIRLEMSGEETEVDKSMLELLGDPLTHLIRNAADHGIETPETRIAAGKPAEGTIWLRACHRSGRVVIEVSEDGGGIDPARVRARAIESGLVAPDAQLNDDQIRMLIFEPGFSTRTEVSEFSGRGVGLDVVLQNVRQLNGTVSVSSETGRGATVTIELPLTLAILEGLLVRVADRTLVLPLLSVVETVSPRAGQVQRVAEQGEVILIRDESIPLLRLRRYLGLAGAPAEAASRSLVVVVEANHKKIGLLVDELLGQQQVAVKSLERHLRKVDGLMGATILGDGCVAPIIDVACLAGMNLYALDSAARGLSGAATAVLQPNQISPHRGKEGNPPMQWFKNLNATARLMASFGVMMVLILSVSYIAVSNLSKANDRVESLYQMHMKGAIRADDITINILNAARFALHAVVHEAEPATVASDEKQGMDNLTQLRANLDEADKLFVTAKGKQELAAIRAAVPGFEQTEASVFEALRNKDLAAARERIEALGLIRKTILEAGDAARQTKQDVAQQQFEENAQAYQTARTLMIGAAVVSLVLAIILSLVIARSFSVPLGQAVIALQQVAAGDLTATLDIDTKDEVGRMAGALNNALEKLRSTLEEVTQGAMHASAASQELAAASQAIASGAQEQAASLEETSASLEEITATVRQSADNARQASQLASGSRDAAEQGQGVVSNAVTAMAEINAASAKIADIIGTIDEIAFQTNLLAVNAAVEAARAGEEGRGFAVVAAEVRSLAQRSAEAAKQIKALIQDSLRKVERGTDLVNKSGETLHGIVSSVKRVTDIVGEIAAAAGEQSTGIEQVNTAMTQMDQVTQSTRRRPRSCPRRRNPFPTRPTTSWSWSRSSR
jgi:methyl-accepting chemotaxis protein/chemotaxis signal transduction protein